MQIMKTEQEIYELIDYASTLYQNHVSNDEIKKAMIRQGADEKLADEIVNVVDKKEKKEKSSNGKYFLILGAILLVAGLTNTINSYLQTPPGETFKVFSKLIIGGAISLFIGLADWGASKAKR